MLWHRTSDIPSNANIDICATGCPLGKAVKCCIAWVWNAAMDDQGVPVSYTHLRAHETSAHL
eukprot:3129566-Alexandrium_andersonii.AAC.1